MEQNAKAISLIITLLLNILLHSCSVQSRSPSSSPSSSPATSPVPAVSGEPIAEKPASLLKPRNGRAMKGGSFPASCHSKCNKCLPCMPVGVSVRVMELEENEYYPQVWKCMCEDTIFPP